MKGYRLRKEKIWTDKHGKTHRKEIGGWFGKAFLSFGMPFIIAIVLSLFFPIFSPLIIGVLIFDYILEIVLFLCLKYGCKEENGWKTLSLSRPPKGVNRVRFGEHEGYKRLRDSLPGSEQWEWFAFNESTGGRIDYPKKMEWSWEQQKETITYFEQEKKEGVIYDKKRV